MVGIQEEIPFVDKVDWMLDKSKVDATKAITLSGRVKKNLLKESPIFHST